MTTREEMRGLAEDIIVSCADRMATIGELRETVKLDQRELRTHLEELRDSRRAMTRQVRVDLSRDAANRKHEVGGMLNGFGQALATMGKEMRADLAKELTDRKREVSIIKHDVAILLRGFGAGLTTLRSELAGGRDEWQKMTATMHSKRGGVAFAAKPFIKDIAEGTAEITPELADIRDRVFEYLANHPDGTKMTELEQAFGLARVQMAKLLKNLMAENKVRKQDLLYLAI